MILPSVTALAALIIAHAALRPAAAQPADTLRAEILSSHHFGDARGMGVDPIGALYVADAGRDVVVKLDAEGRLLATIGGPGAREGEFDDPSAVDPTNGLVLYVADAGNHRIQIFSKAFAYLGSIPLVRTGDESSAQVTYRRQDEEGDGFPTGIPVGVVSSGANEIYAVDADRRAVLKWNENRRLARVIGGVDAGRGALGDPVDLCVGPESLLYVADRGAGEVAVYDYFGTFVRSIGSNQLTGVRAVTVIRETIYAALSHAVVRFDGSGRFLQRHAVEMPEPIVDLVAGRDGALYALGSTRVYRLHMER